MNYVCESFKALVRQYNKDLKIVIDSERDRRCMKIIYTVGVRLESGGFFNYVFEISAVQAHDAVMLNKGILEEFNKFKDLYETFTKETNKCKT